MTTTRLVEIQGLDKVYARLAKLKGETVAKTTQRAVSKALKNTYKPAMQAAAPKGRTGKLAKAVDVRVAKKRTGEMFALKVGPGGKRGPNKAWYAHFVVGGTKPHLITAAGTKSPTTSRIVRRANRGGLALTVAGMLVSVVHHPGAKPNPFPRWTAVTMSGLLDDLLVRELIKSSEP